MEELFAADKRKYRRFRVKEPVQFQVKDQQELCGSLSNDISKGGIQLTLFKFVPVNASLSLQVQLFPQHNIECQGRVVWVERKQYSDIYNVGIEFTQTSSLLDSQREIEELSSRPSINNL